MDGPSDFFLEFLEFLEFFDFFLEFFRGSVHVRGCAAGGGGRGPGGKTWGGEKGIFLFGLLGVTEGFGLCG
jgi:hypothetical protein